MCWGLAGWEDLIILFFWFGVIYIYIVPPLTAKEIRCLDFLSWLLIAILLVSLLN